RLLRLRFEARSPNKFPLNDFIGPMWSRLLKHPLKCDYGNSKAATYSDRRQVSSIGGCIRSSPSKSKILLASFRDAKSLLIKNSLLWFAVHFNYLTWCGRASMIDKMI